MTLSCDTVLAATAIGDELEKASSHGDAPRGQVASQEQDLEAQEDAVSLHEAAVVKLEKELSSREEAVASWKSSSVGCEDTLRACEEMAGKEAAVLESEHQLCVDEEHKEAACRSSIRKHYGLFRGRPVMSS